MQPVFIVDTGILFVRIFHFRDFSFELDLTANALSTGGETAQRF
jgi:hypothetical protein